MVDVTFIPSRIELAIIVDVEGNIEDIGVIVECFLDTISCDIVSLHEPHIWFRPARTMMDIPR